MENFFGIGSTPVNEPAAQIGQPNYYRQARRECRAFMGQIRRQFGEEPLGAVLFRQSTPNDCGHDFEVVIIYNDYCPDAVKYAFHVESHLPLHWDDIAKEELGLIRPCPQL